MHITNVDIAIALSKISSFIKKITVQKILLTKEALQINLGLDSSGYTG